MELDDPVICVLAPAASPLWLFQGGNMSTDLAGLQWGSERRAREACLPSPLTQRCPHSSWGCLSHLVDERTAELPWLEGLGVAHG